MSARETQGQKIAAVMNHVIVEAGRSLVRIIYEAVFVGADQAEIMTPAGWRVVEKGVVLWEYGREWSSKIHITHNFPEIIFILKFHPSIDYRVIFIYESGSEYRVKLLLIYSPVVQ